MPENAIDESRDCCPSCKRWLGPEKAVLDNCPGCQAPLTKSDPVERCKCGAPKSEWEKRNHSQVYIDYDWYCTRCGQFVRVSSH